MKAIRYILLLSCTWLVACKKTIDLYPQSNLNAGTFYSNLDEMKSALTGIYNGLQKPLLYEWQFTELRSDNSKQDVVSSSNTFNRELSDLDMFIPSPAQINLYYYWLTTYNNIYSANTLLQNLGVVYNPST